MENDNNIKRIIQLYFGKHFSRSGRVLFGRWLRAEDGASEKTDMLQAFWEHSPAEATVETGMPCKDIYRLNRSVGIPSRCIVDGSNMRR